VRPAADKLLIARGRQGDPAAFEALYDRYKGQVFRTALAITRDQDHVLQECMVRLHRSLASLDCEASRLRSIPIAKHPDCEASRLRSIPIAKHPDRREWTAGSGPQGVDDTQPLAPWLYRACLCYNWLTHKRRWLQSLEEAVEWLSVLPQPSPLQIVEQREVRTVIEQAINSLSLDQRVTLVLYYLNGLSVDEVAFVLDCPLGTVKSRLHYGCQKLRRRLLSEGRALQEVAYELSS
jgi:RNA polymerase sigma-70 factor (ECF subfamily)